MKPMARMEKMIRKDERKIRLPPARNPKAAPVLRMWVRLNRFSITGIERCKGMVRSTINFVA
jgi:hypothetical protein